MANTKECLLCGALATITGPGENDYVCSNENCLASEPSRSSKYSNEKAFADKDIENIRRMEGWGKYSKK